MMKKKKSVLSSLAPAVTFTHVPTQVSCLNLSFTQEPLRSTCHVELSSLFSKPCCLYHFYLSSLHCCDPGFQKRERCCSDVARGTELPYMLLLFSSSDPSQSFSNQMRTGWLLWPVGKTAPLSWLKSLVGLLFKSCLGEKTVSCLQSIFDLILVALRCY